MSDPLKTQNLGSHPDILPVGDVQFQKARDLRYGENPSQTAAMYASPQGTFLSTLKELKTGKQGPSQTNMEDMVYGAVTLGYFEAPSVVIMKHLNPSGFATQYAPEPLSATYRKAREGDFRAAFGGTVLFNRPVDLETADALNELFREVIVAPGFDEGVVDRFKGTVRVYEYDERQFSAIPRYANSERTPIIKQLPDGTLIRSNLLVTPIKNWQDLQKYAVGSRQFTADETGDLLKKNKDKTPDQIEATLRANRTPHDGEFRDLLTGYRIRLRSNSVRMVRNGYTVALGTGQQDRVMCVDIAEYKNRKLMELADKEERNRYFDYFVPGSVLVSDGFFPFPDSIELARKFGITAVLAPHGGDHFLDVVQAANESGIAFVDLPGDLRFFAHY